MNDLWTLITSADVNVPGSIFKLILSLVLGALIGLERRSRGQIAGMRTFALISMGACLAMIISIYIPQTYFGLKNGDPGRIAAQVISGIGFLGAGAIIQMKGSVRGLTTAAGIWMTAAVGLAVGAGMYIISVAAFILIVLILNNVEDQWQRFFKAGSRKNIRMQMDGIVEDLNPFQDIFKSYGVLILDCYVKHDYKENQTIVNFMLLAKGKTDFMAVFKGLRELSSVESISISNEVND